MRETAYLTILLTALAAALLWQSCNHSVDPAPDPRIRFVNGVAFDSSYYSLRLTMDSVLVWDSVKAIGAASERYDVLAGSHRLNLSIREDSSGHSVLRLGAEDVNVEAGRTYTCAVTGFFDSLMQHFEGRVRLWPDDLHRYQDHDVLRVASALFDTLRIQMAFPGGTDSVFVMEPLASSGYVTLSSGTTTIIGLDLHNRCSTDPVPVTVEAGSDSSRTIYFVGFGYEGSCEIRGVVLADVP